MARNSTNVGGNASGVFVQAGRNVRISFGKRWPDLLVVVALVVLGIVAVVAMNDDEPGTPVTAAESPTLTTTTPATTTDEPTTATTRATDPPPTQAAGGFALVFQDRMELASTDVDSDPPRRARVGTYWVDYLPRVPAGFNGASLIVNGGMVAEWTTSSAEPGPEECADQLAASGTLTVPLRDAGVYCLQSRSGRVVLISDLQRTPDAYTALITVWDSTSP
ncbi:hypothetical protein [Actinokineospora sp. NPDC004072]